MQRRQLLAMAALGLSAAACAARQAPPAERSFKMYWPTPDRPEECGFRDCDERLRSRPPRCELAAREVRAWGTTPREMPPAGRCPTRVRVYGDRVVAESVGFEGSFDALPWDECVPRQYLTGARHVLRVDDGWLVAYEGAFENDVFWASEDGRERRTISRARVLGFARAPSGAVLALAAGRARLGRGAVLRLEHAKRGQWTPTIVTVLPIQPAGAAFDDGGVLVGFAEGFVFRVDEAGELENVHDFARDIGRVASIARAARGAYFLGLECGILRVDPEEHREEWWSARDGASGRWSSCGT